MGTGYQKIELSSAKSWHNSKCPAGVAEDLELPTNQWIWAQIDYYKLLWKIDSAYLGLFSVSILQKCFLNWCFVMESWSQTQCDDDEPAWGPLGPQAGEEEELRLVFKISISLLARLEISKLEVFSKICATNLNAYSEKSPRTYPGLAKMCLFRTSDY